jgi:bifunctional DNA-binding transcriptional regulator/antitoxin component of YhaV-PrlF toxin-antitoxin module
MDVLIIDDHPLIHETLSAMVQKAIPGSTVHAELELGAAITRGMALPDFRLALLDLGLPGYSGIEALQRFRSAFPGAGDRDFRHRGSRHHGARDCRGRFVVPAEDRQALRDGGGDQVNRRGVNSGSAVLLVEQVLLRRDPLVPEHLLIPRLPAGVRLCPGGAGFSATTEESRNQRQQTVQRIQSTDRDLDRAPSGVNYAGLISLQECGVCRER